MNFREYQEKAMRTDNKDLNPREDYLMGTLGLVGETGEVTDIVKKFLFHGHDMNKAKFGEEIGDCLWYLAKLAKAAGLDLQDIAEYNVTKLLKRYPNEFSHEASRNRKV